MQYKRVDQYVVTPKSVTMSVRSLFIIWDEWNSKIAVTMFLHSTFICKLFFPFLCSRSKNKTRWSKYESSSCILATDEHEYFGLCTMKNNDPLSKQTILPVSRYTQSIPTAHDTALTTDDCMRWNHNLAEKDLNQVTKNIAKRKGDTSRLIPFSQLN